MSRTKNRYGRKKRIQKIYKVGIYVRVSVNNKDDSIKNQVELCKEYIAKNKDMTLVRIYEDEGKSGKDFYRRAYGELMRDIDNKKVDCIIVKDISRLGRSFIDLSRIVEYDLVKKRVRLICVNDNYDSKCVDGSMKNLILKSMINEIYIKDTSFKIKKSKEYLRNKGVYLGVFAPYGYKIDIVDGVRKLVVDEKTYRIVEEMCRVYAQRKSYIRVQEWLYKNNVNTKNDYRKSERLYIKDKSKLKKWSIKSIRETIERENYYLCQSINNRYEK